MQGVCSLWTKFGESFNEVIIMRCIKCRSPRIIRFLDGFGKWRIFCKSCQESITLMEFYEVKIVEKNNFEGVMK